MNGINGNLTIADFQRLVLAPEKGTMAGVETQEKAMPGGGKVRVFGVMKNGKLDGTKLRQALLQSIQGSNVSEEFLTYARALLGLGDDGEPILPKPLSDYHIRAVVDALKTGVYKSRIEDDAEHAVYKTQVGATVKRASGDWEVLADTDEGKAGALRAAEHTDAAYVARPAPAAPGEASPAVTAKIKGMILNATARHVGSLKLRDVKQVASKSNVCDKDLEELCRTAEKSFARLGKMSGRQIAAISALGTFGLDKGTGELVFTLAKDQDPEQMPGLREKNPKRFEKLKNHADEVRLQATAIVDAMKGQMLLADRLEQLYRQTGNETFYEMAAASRARECELSAMVIGLGRVLLAERKKDPSLAEGTLVTKDMLDLKASHLLAHFAADMHGNDTTFDLLSKHLAPIADALESLKDKVASGRNDTHDVLSLANLRKEIETARAALRQAAKYGIRLSADDPSRFRPEASVMRAAEKMLAAFDDDLSTLAAKAVERSAEALAAEILPDISKLALFTDPDVTIVKAFFGEDYRDNPEYAQLAESVKSIRALSVEFKTLCREFATGKAGKGKLQAFARKCRTEHADAFNRVALFAQDVVKNLKPPRINAQLRKAILNDPDLGLLKGLDPTLHLKTKEQDAPTFLEAKITVALNRLEKMSSMTAADFKPDDALLLGLLRGDYSATSYIAAKSWNMPPEMLNPGLDDAALVSAERLGSGVANTVYLCTYRMPDGGERQFVFKPEVASRLALNEMNLGYVGYTDDQKVAALNLASRKLAEMLGTDSKITEAYVGVHDGKFGLFMSVAPGVTAEALQNLLKNPRIATKNEQKDILVGFRNVINNWDADKNTCLGSLAHEMSLLEWNDLISGQGDRHWGNYKLSYDRKAAKFNVIGIDNDLSFPSWRLGVFKFRVGGMHAKLLEAQLRGQYGIKLEQLVLDKKPGEAIDLGPKFKGVRLTVRENGEYELDMTPEKGTKLDPALNDFAILLCRSVFGTQKLTVPQFIPEEMRAKLEDLAKLSREEIKELLKADLTDEQVDAFVSRTQDALHFADVLKEDERQIAADDWRKPDAVGDKLKAELENCRNSGNALEQQYLYDPLASDYFILVDLVPEE